MTALLIPDVHTDLVTVRDATELVGVSAVAGLDELGANLDVRHLRAILVATGVLPHRDERLAAVER